MQKDSAGYRFLDIDIPGLDGFSVVNALQNDACRTRFAFVTSHDEEVFQALHYQPFWFVRKSHFEVWKTGEYISFTFRNSIDQSVMQNNHALKTTKANSELHGVGLKSVRSIVKKYDGMLQFYEENNEFCCNILLAHTKNNESKSKYITG